MQTVAQHFHDMAQNSIVPIDWSVGISFDKSFDDSVSFFQLNVSQLNGMDVLAPADDNPIQQWDKYAYTKYGGRVTALEYSRSIDFPYSVQSAMADITLDNYDDYFTPNSSSPISAYILPKRPVRLYAGYKTADTISQLVGLTQKSPEVDEKNKTASFHILDFLSEIFDLPLNQTIAMRDVYTGEVIGAILQQYGILPSQYDIARGRNKIPFLFFEKKQVKAGEVLRNLMQAEMGDLWLTEDGIIRFDPRLTQPETPVMIFNGSNTISIENTADNEIINKVTITSALREVQEFQPIWTKSTSGTSNLNVIPAGGYLTIEASLQDPCYDVVAPTQGMSSNVSWFTTTKADGTEVTTGVTVTDTELRTNSYVMTFYNSTAYDLNIEEAEVWGEPAKQYDTINYELHDDDSVAKYGEMSFDISNDFFGSYENCRSFAYTLLDSYANFANIINMQVMGDVSLQLGDVIDVDYGEYDDTYKIIGISHKLPEEYTIKARLYHPRQWFTLDQSQLNGTDVLAP